MPFRVTPTLSRSVNPPRHDQLAPRDFIPRRKSDIERYAVLGGLLATVISIGIAWGTASATVNQKLDRSTFDAHVADANRRFLADSLRASTTDAALHRIELKQDSTNHRLQLLVCENKPSYCQ